MAISPFYEKTQGLTFLTIKHVGRDKMGRLCFEYVNSPGRQNIYHVEQWLDLIQFMREGHYYVIPAIVSNGVKHATLMPIGIVAELSNSEARKFASQHYAEVLEGLWKPDLHLVQACRDAWADWRKAWMDALDERLHKNTVTKHKLVEY